MPFDYEALNESLAAAVPDDAELVGGDFDLVGAIELAALRAASLQPTDVLVDLGCGTGRLALRALPFLDGGHYIGIEISRTVLRRAQRRVADECPDPPCEVTWRHNTETTFPLPDASVDVVCAFSVFTHVEHEDAFRYLVDALRVVRRGGRFVFSCLPLNEPPGREVFLASAALALGERWRQVRNFTTSYDFMDAISTLAGWQVVAWYGGDHAFSLRSERGALGQSVCVLGRP